MGKKNEQRVIQLLSTMKETFKKGIWSTGVRCEWKGSLNSSSGRPPDKRHLNKGEGGKPNIIIGRRHRTADEKAWKPKVFLDRPRKHKVGAAEQSKHRGKSQEKSHI